MDNFVTLVGRLTAEPELRFTPGGDAVANGRIARNVRQKNSNGEWEDGRAQFFAFNVWGKVAERIALLPKGTLVRLTGELDFREWENNDGDRRSVVEIKARTCDPLLAAGEIDETADSFTVTWGAGRREGGDRPGPTGGRPTPAPAQSSISPWDGAEDAF